MSVVSGGGSFERMRAAVETILREIGEDPTREGLIDTPSRVARMYLELTEGLRTDPPRITTFSSDGLDQLVTLFDVDYSSLCEHHTIPFYGVGHIGYLPGERLMGLSKFARVLDWFAARPQIQERMTAQVADYIMSELNPRGVVILIEGTHTCMSMRGVKKPNHTTITSAIRGDVPRDEFFDLLNSRRR
jgi:GTP cyclohydrolase I